jgi:tetratricopeptide (TPR) repeat protein
MRRAWNWLMSRLYRSLADAHRHFGNLYGNRQDHWLAIENYTRALVHDPAYTQAYYSRGVLYWREVDNPYRAIQDLSRVLELDERWADAYFNRAVAHRMRQEREQAVADFRAYLAYGDDEFWLGSAGRQLAELQEEMDEQGRPDGQAPRQV